MSTKRQQVLLVLCSFLLVACDDPPPPNQEWVSTGSGPGAKPKPPPQKKPKKTKPRVEVELIEKDFIEGPENRDPFRSFLGGFKQVIIPPKIPTRKVLMAHYGLDELKLIGVVTGQAVRPRAMFRDPKGLGVTVRRGDYISKSASKVKRILHDKVVVEIEEMVETKDQASRKTTISNRLIELHPKEDKENREEDETIPSSTIPVEEESGQKNKGLATIKGPTIKDSVKKQ